MSILERTTAQLVRNRVHELCDRVMDMNIKQGRHIQLSLTPSGVSVNEEMADKDSRLFYATLPPLTTPVMALEELEDMLSSVRAHQSQGGAQ